MSLPLPRIVVPFRNARVRFLTVCSVAGAYLAIAGCGEARDGTEAPRVHLGEAMVLPDSFTYVTSIRPLPNGSFILTDPQEQRVELRSFSATGGAPIARRGYGPAEWSRAVALVPSSTEGSVQFDPVERRLHFYVGAKLVRVAPPDSVSTPSLAVLGASDDSILYFLVPPGPASAIAAGGVDSLAVVRFNLASRASDTLAVLRDAPGTIVTRTDDEGTRTPIAIQRPAFAVGEQGIAFPDGWLAVARLDPYRVEWREPNGHWHRGGVLPLRRRPLTAEVKDAYLRQNAPIIERLGRAPNDVRAALMSRFENFPAALPPIGPDALRAGYDGRLYVERIFLPLDSTRVYDVIDRRGERTQVLVLPKDERLVAVTGQHVFAVRVDSLDIQRVIRYLRAP